MTVYCCPFHHESCDHEAQGFSRSDSAYRRQLDILRYAQTASLRAIIAGMSRRCVLRGALTQECCQNSVTAPRPDCKAHARFFR